MNRKWIFDGGLPRLNARTPGEDFEFAETTTVRVPHLCAICAQRWEPRCLHHDRLSQFWNSIRAIRQSFHSQAVFARIINVSLNTVESWEQGARRPREATLKLLTIAHRYPEVFLSA